MTKQSGSEQKLTSYSNQFSQMGFDIFLRNINHLIWLVFVHLSKKRVHVHIHMYWCKQSLGHVVLPVPEQRTLSWGKWTLSLPLSLLQLHCWSCGEEMWYSPLESLNCRSACLPLLEVCSAKPTCAPKLTSAGRHRESTKQLLLSLSVWAGLRCTQVYVLTK